MSNRYKRILKSLKNYKSIARKVKKIIHELDPQAKIYVFGSTVRGDYTAASDIDILVVTSKLDKKYKMMTEVYSRIDAPIELHITTEDTMKKWYLKFINEEEIEEI